MRSTVAIINKTLLRNNYKSIKTKTNGAAVVAIVKANAYGHGILECSKVLVEEGVDFLGVAFPEEGVQIRNAGIETPIIVLVPAMPHEAEIFCRFNLQPAISSYEFAEALSHQAARYKMTVKAHLFIDTGMSREGIPARDILPFFEKCSRLKNISFIGVCTHFATAPSDIEFAEHQLDLFNTAVKQLHQAGHRFKHVHAANTSAIGNLPHTIFNTVRPGISLYGYPPTMELYAKFNVEPIMTLKTNIVVTRRIFIGDSVGYDRLFIADKDTTIATIPIGYGDGWFKTLTGKAQCLIEGKRYTIVGSICMDECMIDIGDEKFAPGEEVILIGKQGSESIDAHELAAKIGTIPYEITTALMPRIERIFIENQS